MEIKEAPVESGEKGANRCATFLINFAPGNEILDVGANIFNTGGSKPGKIVVYLRLNRPSLEFLTSLRQKYIT